MLFELCLYLCNFIYEQAEPYKLQRYSNRLEMHIHKGPECAFSVNRVVWQETIYFFRLNKFIAPSNPSDKIVPQALAASKMLADTSSLCSFGKGAST